MGLRLVEYGARPMVRALVGQRLLAQIPEEPVQFSSHLLHPQFL